MRGRFWISVCMVAVALSGCFGEPGEADEAGSGDPSDPASLLTDQESLMEDCDTLVAAFYVDEEPIQRMLPKGYQVDDLGHLFSLGDSLPVEPPTDKASVILYVQQCGSWSGVGEPVAWASAVVDIEAPEVEGYGESDHHDAYELWRGTSSARMLNLFQEREATTSEANLTVDHRDVGTAVESVAEVQDTEGVAMRFEAITHETGEGPIGLMGWYQTDRGVGVFEFMSVDLHPLRAGALTSCEVREGSVLHEILGTTSCLDNHKMATTYQGMDLEVRDRFVPGVAANSTAQ